MLVLSRKPNEAIVIHPGTPQEVTFVLLECSGNRARVGIVADQSIPILRGELVEMRKAAEREEEEERPAPRPVQPVPIQAVPIQAGRQGRRPTLRPSGGPEGR